jgi:formyl-CoA transferase
MPLEPVAPSNTYPCKPFGINDFVHIYCSRHPGSKQFDNLCRVMGREDLLTDERFKTPRSRYTNRDVLDPIIAEWTGRHTKQDAMDILAKQDIPAGALLDADDITNDPQYLARGMIVEMDHKDHGKLKIPGFAPRLSENHIEYTVSPDLGASNKKVYQEILGLSDEEIQKLKDAKAI